MYDLNNPKEREMYLKKRENDLKRVFDKTKTPQEKYKEILEQQQEEIKYFREKQQQQEAEKKEILKEVEETTEKAIKEVLNTLKISV